VWAVHRVCGLVRMVGASEQELTHDDQQIDARPHCFAELAGMAQAAGRACEEETETTLASAGVDVAQPGGFGATELRHEREAVMHAKRHKPKLPHPALAPVLDALLDAADPPETCSHQFPAFRRDATGHMVMQGSWRRRGQRVECRLCGVAEMLGIEVAEDVEPSVRELSLAECC